eukprot:6183176-Pleurochrysis_carterae.AAC.7
MRLDEPLVGGPLLANGPETRRCHDVAWLVALLLCWTAMGSLTYLAVSEGDARRLTSGMDYSNHICGTAGCVSPLCCQTFAWLRTRCVRSLSRRLIVNLSGACHAHLAMPGLHNGMNPFQCASCVSVASAKARKSAAERPAELFRGAGERASPRNVHMSARVLRPSAPNGLHVKLPTHLWTLRQGAPRVAKVVTSVSSVEAGVSCMRRLLPCARHAHRGWWTGVKLAVGGKGGKSSQGLQVLDVVDTFEEHPSEEKPVTDRSCVPLHRRLSPFCREWPAAPPPRAAPAPPVDDLALERGRERAASASRRVCRVQRRCCVRARTV